MALAESGSAAYTVILDALTASDVVITVSSDNSDVTGDTVAATSGNQTTLTFSHGQLGHGADGDGVGPPRTPTR